MSFPSHFKLVNGVLKKPVPSTGIDLPPVPVSVSVFSGIYSGSVFIPIDPKNRYFGTGIPENTGRDPGTAVHYFKHPKVRLALIAQQGSDIIHHLFVLSIEEDEAAWCYHMEQFCCACEISR
jgi:hypothetical protein